MVKPTRYLLGSLLLLCIFSLQGCSSRPLDPGTLRAGGDWTPPPVYHGNPFGFGGVGAAYHFVFEPLFSYIPATDDWLPRLGERFEDEGDSTTVFLRKNAYWHDETPVTAQDIRANFLLLTLRGHPMAEFCREIEVLDEHTLRFHWRFRTEDLKILVFSELMFFQATSFPEPMSAMEEFIRLDLRRELDAPDELRTRLTSVRQEMLRYRPPMPMGTGPFRMTKVTASEMVFEKFALHPLAHKLDFDALRLFRISSNEVGWALLLSGQLDFIAMMCPIDLSHEIERRNPSMKMALPEDGTEIGLVFNSRKLSLPLRQALLHVLDRDIVREIAFPFADTVDDLGLGVIASRRQDWLSPQQLRAFEARGHDPAKAERLLAQAGYRKTTRGWLDSEGRPLTLTITCRAGYSDFILMAEVASSQWESFGIPTQIRVVQPDIYPTLLSGGDFQVTATLGVMQGRFSTPVSGLERFYFPDNELQKATGMPRRLTVADQQINTAELITRLKYEDDPAELRQGVYLLARALYEAAVYVPIFEKRNPMFFNEGPVVDNWPELDHPYWSNVVCGAEQTFLNMLLFTEAGRAKPR